MSTNGSTPEQIEADIARQREQLAGTINDLQAKLDVKTRAKGKAAELRARSQGKAAELRTRTQGRSVALRSRTQGKALELKSRATTDDGRPTPQAIGGAAAATLALVALGLLRRRNRR